MLVSACLPTTRLLWLSFKPARVNVTATTRVGCEEQMKILTSSKYTHWQNMMLLVTEILTFLTRNVKLTIPHFPKQTTAFTLCLKHQKLSWRLIFSQKWRKHSWWNRLYERVALHLRPNSADLNRTELVCGDIKSRIATKNLKETQVFS